MIILVIIIIGVCMKKEKFVYNGVSTSDAAGNSKML